MEKSVFISRNLSPDSLFRIQLEAADFMVTGRSLLDFKAIPFTDFPSTDWIFFYSRKAVEFFLTQIQNLPTDLKIAAYGSGTAEALKIYKVTPDFVGTGEGISTFAAFTKIAGHQPTVLFPQALHSRRTVENLAGDQIKTFPLVVYDNVPRKNIEVSTATFLVFTSPLNVKAYFDHYKLAKNQKIIVIGKTTGAELDTDGIVDFEVAKTPSEEGLAVTLLDYLNRDSL